MWYKSFWLALGTCLVIGKTFALSKQSALAQSNIAADNTLGAQTTVVTPNVNINGIKSDQISGGATRGVNLFHSFREFNVDLGQAAYFNNPAGIQNILTRVTGINPSKILGTLGVIGGNANLFLMNPNGIIFGENARLDIGGSFVGTTAHGIGLTNGDIFSSNPLQPLPSQLLNVNPNAFLFNQIANQQINSIQVNKASLSVPSGNSLLLLGGNISLDNGKLQAANGVVELGGVTTSGKVGLQVDNSNFSLSFPLDIQKADISFLNNASVNVSDKGAGNVALTGRNIDILGGNISAGVGKRLTADNSPRGDITLDATGKLTINYPSRVTNIVDEGATGNAGNINIKAGEISITNKASTRTTSRIPATLDTGPGGQEPGQKRGEGRAGNISLEATGSIFLVGQDQNSDDRVISTYNGVGQSGNISLKADNSISLDNAFFIASSFGGDGGDISLQGRQSVSAKNNSSMVSVAFGRGVSGNITIESSGAVSLQDTLVNTAVGGGNRINLALGDAGDINIRGQSVFITDGTEVSSRSFNGGKSGRIFINGSDQVEISGMEPATSQQSDRSDSFKNTTLTTVSQAQARGDAGDININTRNLRVSDGGTVSAESRSNFRGGNININASRVELTNNGQISVSSLGRGTAGSLTLKANSITLDNQSKLQASTSANEGGNINLQVQDFILMRRNSLISAEARNNANGGNIKISQPFIVAVPAENSDIIANADQGRGGTITITSGGVYGLQKRPQRTNLSDINASSQAGLNGRVEINDPNIDPNQGLVNLPVEFVEPKVSQVCQAGAGRNKNSFVITGRGGLPASPTEPLNSDAVIANWITINPESETRSTQSVRKNSNNSTPQPIVEASGWVINAKGEVFLTVDASTLMSYGSWRPATNCTASD